MRKLAILSLVAILILSGCVSKTTDNKNGTQTQSSIVNDINTLPKAGNTDANIEDNAQIGVNRKEETDSVNTGSDIGYDWCVPGNKINVNLPSGKEEFTVTGITTYTDDNGKTYNGLCRAEKTIKGGSSVKYFNKEGTIDIMKSESSSKDGSARAEASASVSVTGK